MILAIGLCLLGGCASEQATAPAPPALAVPGNTLQGRQYGMVYLIGPQVEAEISVVNADGTVPFRTRSNGNGAFELRDLPVSQPFKVVATLRDGTVLERASAGQDFLWIDLVSHMTSLYAAAHRDLTLVQAVKAVRAGLAIPDDVGTNGLGSLAGSPFAARLFVEQARVNGGVNAYARQVVERIGKGQVLSFSTPSQRVGLRLLHPTPTETIRASGVSDLLGFLGSALGGDVVSVGVNNLVGMGLSAIGLNIGTSGKLNEMQQTLTEVSQELLALENEVQAVNVTQELSGILNTINGTIDTIKTDSNQLAQVAGTAASNNATNTDFNHGPTVPNPAAQETAVSDSQDAQNAVRQLLSYLLGPEGQNLVLLYNLYGTQKFYPANFNYLQNFNYSQRQDRWTAGDVSVPQNYSLQGNLDYYRTLVIQACNLWSEAAQLSVIAQPVSKSGLFPPATFLNGARSGVSQAELGLIAAQNQIPELTNQPVFIDLTQNKMWYLQYFTNSNGQPGGTGVQLSSAQGFAYSFQCGTWGPAPPPASTDYQSNYCENPQKAGPSGGWRLPTAQEYFNLRVLAGGSLYPGLANLGFILPDAGGTNARSHVYGALYEANYHAFDWAKNDCYQEGNSTGGGPLWGYMLVRDIPDFTSGDTPQLAHACYGFLPDSLQMLGDFPTTQQNGIITVQGNVNGVSGSSQLGHRVQWSSSDPSILDFSPNGQYSLTTNWHNAGTVTVTATVRGSTPSQAGTASSLQSVSTSVNMTSPLTGPDPVTSIQISPYQAQYQAPPLNGQFQQMYLTGFTRGGTCSDLRALASWRALTPQGAALDSSIATFPANATAGSLNFGLNVGTVNQIVVQASYNGMVTNATLTY